MLRACLRACMPSWEDFRLKFTHYKIGSGVTIMSGASATWSTNQPLHPSR